MLLPFTDFMKLYGTHLSTEDKERLLELMHTEYNSKVEVSDSHDY